jgi:signal transduction histidine kinase
VPHGAAFQPFVALTLTAYSVGSRAEGRRALRAPPLLLAASAPVFAAARLHGQQSGNIIPSLLWLVAAWAVGRTVRSWRHQNVALQTANRELTEQRELQAQAAVAVERGRIARIVQEALTNTVKHAGPARVEVPVRYEDGLVALEIADTSRGPDGGRGTATIADRGTGHGLVGMRERAAMFGGELEAAPGDGGGFTVRALLPLPAPASA